jgi:pimeloyl-ACP methyl ester carboxylesterase
MSAAAYTPLRTAAGGYSRVRGLNLHWRSWGDASLVAPGRPPLLMLHGWMDVGASFQFVVDALAAGAAAERWIIAPDWRGFGLSDASGADTYWYPDYLADLDGLLDTLLPGQAVDLLGHSMGANVAMLYAGVRPQRIRRLVNLEGFGLPATVPTDAARRYAQWLDELREPARLRPYANLAEVAQRLMTTNPHLAPQRAAWLAPHWSRPQPAGDGTTLWHLLADPAHKRINPALYRPDEAVAVWRQIRAPVLWVEGDATQMLQRWKRLYPREDFEARLAAVPRLERLCLPDAGHMLHHDQPALLAEALERFLCAPD